MSRVRNVRLSQTLVPFGVGAIYDILGESLIGCDTFHWRSHGDVIRIRRLEEALKVKQFRSAPSHTSLFQSRGAGVPYFRFPQWLFCQKCRRMVRWNLHNEVEGEPPKCGSCPKRPQLVPMRFVIACSKGHVGDVPWQFWAHFGAAKAEQKQCHSNDLYFEVRAGRGSGLESLVVECRTCTASRSLQGISASGSLRPLNIKCPARQPWQRAEEVTACDGEPQVLQRGASNLYFGLVKSAIDIPPDSNASVYADLSLKVMNADEFRLLRSSPSGPLAGQLIDVLAGRFECTPERIRAILAADLKDTVGPIVTAADEGLDAGEWDAFITPQQDLNEGNRFITRHVPLVEGGTGAPPSKSVVLLSELIDRVVLAVKLREVRALVGFSRYDPEGTLVEPDLGRGLDWLPAIEVFGEGVFLSLSETALQRWEENEQAQALAAVLEQRRKISLFGKRLPRATPRFLLLHSLAHLVIRELALQCGYSSSSLRERIYARMPSEGTPQAGLLVYTAAGDVEGTLGGLARQGEPPRLLWALLSALDRASWCSADPICRENRGQGFGSLNLGACHACTLLSETSCDHGNTLLDRSFVVNTSGGNGVPGYFDSVLDAARLDVLDMSRA